MFVLLASPVMAQNYLPIIQSCAGPAVSTPNACIFGKNVTSGNIIIVVSTWETSANTPSIADTRSSTYNQSVLNTSNTVQGGVYCATLGSSGANTVTWTQTSATFQTITAVEVDGSQYTCTTDVTDSKTFSTSVSTTPVTVSGNAVTATLNGEFMFCGIGANRSAAVEGSGTGFTQIGFINNNDATGEEYKVTGTNGSNTCSFSNINNDVGTIFTAVYKPVTTGGQIITSSTLPSAATTHAYSFCPQAIGGVGAYTWSISAGSLPLNFSQNSSTGCITASNPTNSASSFTIQMVGATSGSASQAVTLTVGTSLNTIAVVQSQCCTGVFGSNVASGNVIIVGQRCTASNCRIDRCTDTIGTPFRVLAINSYNTVPGGTAAAQQTASIQAGIAPSSAADTVSCGGGQVLAVAELSNTYIAADNVVDSHGTSASPITSASLTTVVENEYLYALFNAYTNTTAFTASAPFTTLGASQGGFLEYNLATTVTGYTATASFTGNTNGSWGILLAGLRPTASGLAPPSGNCPGCDLSENLLHTIPLTRRYAGM